MSDRHALSSLVRPLAGCAGLYAGRLQVVKPSLLLCTAFLCALAQLRRLAASAVVRCYLLRRTLGGMPSFAATLHAGTCSDTGEIVCAMCWCRPSRLQRKSAPLPTPVKKLACNLLPKVWERSRGRVGIHGTAQWHSRFTMRCPETASGTHRLSSALGLLTAPFASSAERMRDHPCECPHRERSACRFPPSTRDSSADPAADPATMCLDQRLFVALQLERACDCTERGTRRQGCLSFPFMLKLRVHCHCFTH